MLFLILQQACSLEGEFDWFAQSEPETWTDYGGNNPNHNCSISVFIS